LDAAGGMLRYKLGAGGDNIFLDVKMAVGRCW
jgi:hypothetical protein